MILIFEIALLLVCFVIINSFVIYPVIVYLIGKNKSIKNKHESFQPTISVLIAAYNEEKVISARIKNLASQNYDLSKVEVFVGSDCSNDSTNNILLSLKNEFPWLKVFISEKRRGKAGILNDLIKQATGEILVFTDANTDFHTNAIKNLVMDFTDENIGGVCGKLVFEDEDKDRGDGVEEINYWKYETIIKNSEGNCGISLAANGGIFAIRKELYVNIPTDKAVTDDLFISLSVVSKGWKFTYRNDALAYENTGKNLGAEYMRKVRFSATNFQTLVDFGSMLLNKNKFLSYAFFSHKVTRWFLPFLLILVFILSWFLSYHNWAVFWFFILQIFFYLMALIGFVFSTLKIRIRIFSLPYFFVISNMAVVQGFIKFINRKHSVIWQSTER
ncbi:MAG: glycosyltransferase [Ignavibacteriales bacterium]|nr:glycosyltransferase [Ignavibacteriales bacterium]